MDLMFFNVYPFFINLSSNPILKFKKGRALSEKEITGKIVLQLKEVFFLGLAFSIEEGGLHAFFEQAAYLNFNVEI
jgi:hypothetical protein